MPLGGKINRRDSAKFWEILLTTMYNAELHALNRCLPAPLTLLPHAKSR